MVPSALDLNTSSIMNVLNDKTITRHSQAVFRAAPGFVPIYQKERTEASDQKPSRRRSGTAVFACRQATLGDGRVRGASRAHDPTRIEPGGDFSLVSSAWQGTFPSGSRRMDRSSPARAGLRRLRTDF